MYLVFVQYSESSDLGKFGILVGSWHCRKGGIIIITTISFIIISIIISIIIIIIIISVISIIISIIISCESWDWRKGREEGELTVLQVPRKAAAAN